MKSYSQDMEDIIIRSILPDVKEGRYIDIGANDPEVYSVTKAFYEMGWKGINIEPLPDKFKLLQEKRPLDINLNIGIGSKHDRKKLYVNGMGSSFDDFTISYAHMEQSETIDVEIFTLAEIIDEYVDFPVDFCKIDVEGFEKEVLLGVDWEKFRPTLFIMESTIAGTDIPNYENWEYILLQNGYTLKTTHGINRYYVVDNYNLL